jgi:hypothetical protein
LKGGFLNKKDIEVLKTALKEKKEKETFERALGRAIRKEGGDFKRYIELIGKVRDYANLKRVDLLKAAKILVKG